MKIVFSAQGETWQDLVDPRLGRSAGFVIFDEELRDISYIENTDGLNAGHGAGLKMAKQMLDLKADVIITGNGPGEKASEVLNKSNIAIYVGAGEMSLKDAYTAYKDGKLTKL